MNKAEHRKREDALRDNDWETISLGCQGCVERRVCGGLRSSAGLLNGCREFCDCKNPKLCLWVCPKNPRGYFLRKQEINGFDFDDVAFARGIAIDQLPSFISVVFPRVLGPEVIRVPIAALPFSAAFDEQDGDAVAFSSSELAARCSVRAKRWVLSGVEGDQRVERWWKLNNRRSALEKARRSGVVLATTPNFSSIIDVPRPDNLHALKRILICWEEIQNAGICGAIHLNGRTGHDMQRLAEFICVHKEIEFVACEFLTGTSRFEGAQSYLDRIKRLVATVDRPLKLVLRGGASHLDVLEGLFAQVIYLNAAAFSKTHSRKAATVLASGQIKWADHKTQPGESLVDLLRHNLEKVTAAQAIRRSGGLLFGSDAKVSKACVGKRDSSTDDKALQPSFLS
jgi:hypothetical protein